MRRLLVAALFLVAGAAALAEGDPSLVPPGGFAEGWSRWEPQRVFQGAELFGHIDGGAEIFLELGFDALTLQRFRRGEDEVVLEAYRMDDPVAAWGIYLAKCGQETPDPGFRERHTAGKYQLTFVKGRYYVLANNDSGSPEAAKVLLELGKFVASKIASVERPAVLDLLPKEGLVASSVRLIRGRYGLQAAVGSLGDGDFLLLGGKVAAVAGEYRQQGTGTRTLLIADYPSPEVAAAAFARLRDGLEPSFERVASRERRIVLKDRAGKYGAIKCDGARVTVELDLAEKPVL